MTQEDKLRNFYDISIESAKAQSEQMLSEYRAGLEADFESHRSEKERAVSDRMNAETSALRRELTRELSDRQAEIRRKVARRQQEVLDEIFANTADRLSAFRETPEYRSWLLKKAGEAVQFADGDAVTIYLDPEDAAYADEIEAVCGILPTVSKEAFAGGMRAVIREQRILIDNSFAALMAEEKDKFRFDGGGPNG